MSFGCIYIVTNTFNGKCYVGQTTLMHEERWTYHVKLARGNLGYALHAAIRKYGVDAFTCEKIIDCDSQVELDSAETHFIASLKTQAPTGYNLRTGGMGGCHSELTKRKIDAAHVGRSKTHAHRKKISEGLRRTDKNKGKNNPNWGKFGTAHHLSRGAQQLSTAGVLLAEYGSASEASRVTGFNRSYICKCAHQKKPGLGFIWKWKQ